MSTLTGRTIASSYKDLLQVSNSNAGVDATLRNVEDGEGTASALYVSTTGVSVPGSGTANESFGNGANASLGSGSNNTCVGNSAIVASASSGNTLVGKGAVSVGADCTVVGYAAGTAGTQGVAIGAAAGAYAYAMAIGFGSSGTATDALAVGRYAVSSHTSSIAIGAASATTAANQFMIGGVGYITQVKFPNTTSGAGTNISILGSDAGSGNSNGGSITLTPGLKAGSGADGNVVLGRDGTVSVPAIGFATNPNLGLYCLNVASFGFAYQGTYMGSIDANSFWQLPVAYQLAWTSVSIPGANDTGLARSAAAVVRVTNGSTGLGKTLTGVLVEANTAGSGSPNILTAAEARTVLTNEGTTAENYHTLPTAAAGLDFEFVCQDADGIRVVADTGDTIRDVATVSASAGYIRSSTIGSVIRVKAINATEWFVVYKQGTWTVDA